MCWYCFCRLLFGISQIRSLNLMQINILCSNGFTNLGHKINKPEEIEILQSFLNSLGIAGFRIQVNFDGSRVPSKFEQEREKLFEEDY